MWNISNKKVCYFALLLLCAFYVLAFAHKDRIITIENGNLIGLPEEYQPAKLNLQKMYLQIGHNRLDFPPCISKYFPEDNQYTLEIAASWYHDLSILPPYLSISIKPNGKDYSFDLMFDMDTLNPIEFEIEIRESPTLIFCHQIKIDKHCLESIKNSLTKIKR
jgi:hypothetical protein